MKQRRMWRQIFRFSRLETASQRRRRTRARQFVGSISGTLFLFCALTIQQPAQSEEAASESEYLDETVPRRVRALYDLDLYGERATPPEVTEPLKVPPDSPVLYGVDVSRWQRTVNWKTVAAQGLSFAVAKASEGRWKDRAFADNWRQLAATRNEALLANRAFYRGAYHFFRPQEDARQQAELFVQTIGGRLEPGDLPPTLDIEWDWSDPRKLTGDRWDGLTNVERVQRIKTWLEVVEQGTGRTPMIYTSYHFWTEKIGSWKAFSRYPLWIADYSYSSFRAQAPLHLPVDCPPWAFWQYSGSGRVEGVQGPVDLNRFQGSLNHLKVLAGLLPASAVPELMASSVSTAGPLRRGAQGLEVAELQKRLIALGYLREDVLKRGLGSLGPRTEAALKAFQRDAGLPGTGAYGAETKKLLEQLAQGLGEGSTSPLAQRVKERLVDLKLLPLQELKAQPMLLTGSAVKALTVYQTSKSLRVTGTITVETWRGLVPAVSREVEPEGALESEEEG